TVERPPRRSAVSSPSKTWPLSSNRTPPRTCIRVSFVVMEQLAGDTIAHPPTAGRLLLRLADRVDARLRRRGHTPLVAGRLVRRDRGDLTETGDGLGGLEVLRGALLVLRARVEDDRARLVAGDLLAVDRHRPRLAGDRV